VQLRLRGARGAAQNRRDLVVPVTLDILQHQHSFVSGWDGLEGALDSEAINQPLAPQVRNATFVPGRLLSFTAQRFSLSSSGVPNSTRNTCRVL
jgi:hypothetical protein